MQRKGDFIMKQKQMYKNLGISEEVYEFGEKILRNLEKAVYCRQDNCLVCFIILS